MTPVAEYLQVEQSEILTFYIMFNTEPHCVLKKNPDKLIKRIPDKAFNKITLLHV